MSGSTTISLHQLDSSSRRYSVKIDDATCRDDFLCTATLSALKLSDMLQRRIRQKKLRVLSKRIINWNHSLYEEGEDVFFCPRLAQ